MSAEARAPASPEAQAVCIALATDLARAMKNTSFYDPTHPVVRRVLAGLHAALREYLAQEPEFSLRLLHGYAVLQGAPFLWPHASIGNLLGACHRRGAQSVLIRRGVTLEELEHLVAVLVTEPAQLEREGGIDRALEARGVEHISIGRQAGSQGRDWRLVHSTALDVLRSAALGLRTGQALDLTGVQGSAREIVENLLGDRSLLHNLTALKGMDEYTFVHALDICVLASALGRQLGLDRGQLTELGIATLLHDVGKVLVPLEILRKPGPLDREEFETMARHPVDGAAMLLHEPKLPEAAALVTFEHHMRFDLSGYPKTRTPRELNVYSLMACIADIYDALTTIRPYRPPLPPVRALELMEKECRPHVEPQLFRQFVRMLGPYPWGSLVGLPDGRLAVMTRPNAADPENPYARAIDTEAQPPRAEEVEVPVRELAPAGELTMLDPVDLGLDLTAVLHGVYTGGSVGEVRAPAE